MNGIESFFGGTWIDQRANLATITEVADLGVDTGNLSVSFAPVVNRPGRFPGTKTVPDGQPAFIDVNFTDADVTVRGTMQLDGQVILWSNDTLWLRQKMDPAAS